MSNRPILLFLVSLAAILIAGPVEAQGRLVGRDARVYAGVGAGEGVGVVLVGSSPVLDVFTREAALSLTYRSGAEGDAGRLVTAGSVGVGVRLLRLASIARSRGIPTGDLDVGIRVGPSFSLALGNQSEAQSARAFGVFLDPFVRATRRLGRADAFVEVGPQAPNVRLGVSARLGE